jgi:hypothetical protein
MNALCIDGPARGQIHYLKDRQTFAFPSITAPDYPVVYYSHRFNIGGATIILASVHLMADEIHPYDLYEFVVSDLAKKAVI